MPVDQEGVPLCFYPEFKDNHAAMVWLWKDHTSFTEAAQITELARKIRPEYLAEIGGVYSSEWFWSKILHIKNSAPEVFNAAYSYLEICDYIPAVLTGLQKPSEIKRSICAAGHKALFNEKLGGLPDEEFLNTLSDGLGNLRKQLYYNAYSSGEKFGNISHEWASKLGLSEDTVVAVGAFDAHMGAVGAGVKPGTLVKILGTSTCDIMIWPNSESVPAIPGICGMVNGSVVKDYIGVEAGQSAVGDIFYWFVNNYVPEKYGLSLDEKFTNLEAEASLLKPGESGLLALDWNNGNRTVLVDVRLTGSLIGYTLHSTVPEIYRALIESTAFGALTIINRFEEYNIDVNEIVNCGGLAIKSPLIMQIYADVTGRPMKISRSEQTPALGAAIFGAVAAGSGKGGFNNVEDAQQKLTGTTLTFTPDEENHLIYNSLYKLYKQLHDGFGTKEWEGSMYNVMKDLLNIRDRQRSK